MINVRFNLAVLWAVLWALMVGFSGVILAGEQSDEQAYGLVDKVVAAYGGERLTALKSLTVVDKYKSFRYGQSYSSDAVEMVNNHYQVTVDLVNGRKDFRWVYGYDGDFATQHQQFDGKTGYRINHTGRTIKENKSLNFVNTDRRHFYMLDTSLVWLLHKAKSDGESEVSYQGQASIYGDKHEVLSVKVQGYPQLTLFIDAQSHQITKMKMPFFQQGKFFQFHYSDFSKQQGIGFAKDTYITGAGDPFKAVTAREVRFNDDVETIFQLPEGFGEVPKTMDFSQMTVKKISDNTYLSGQNWGFSVFVDAGDYFIATGGYAKLKERLAVVQELSGKSNPLKYIVVSHHHNDHLGGMKEAFELGAQFIAHSKHVESIRQRAGIDIGDDRFVLVDGKGAFAQRNIEVFDFPNSHSSHNLITYVPAAKLLFSVDFYFSRQVEGAPSGHKGLQRLKQKLDDLDFTVENFAAAHSARVLSAADFNYSLNNMSNKTICPTGWLICEL